MNFWDILILAAVAVLLLFALRRILRRDTEGCCGNCISCVHSCTKKKEQT